MIDQKSDFFAKICLLTGDSLKHWSAKKSIPLSTQVSGSCCFPQVSADPHTDKGVHFLVSQEPNNLIFSLSQHFSTTEEIVFFDNGRRCWSLFLGTLAQLAEFFLRGDWEGEARYFD